MIVNKAQESVKKSTNDCQILQNKYHNLTVKSDNCHKEYIKRVVNIEIALRKNEHEVSGMKYERGKVESIINDNLI